MDTKGLFLSDIVHKSVLVGTSPSWELWTASPRGRYWGTPSAWPCLKHTYIKTPPVGRRQPMTSLPARPLYKGRRENTSFSSSSEACIRSMAHSLGDAVSRSPSGKHGYIRNLRRSPSWELRTASPRGRYWGTLIPTPPCWGECKPISRKRRALSQLYQAKGVAPGTVDGCQWHYPLRPKTRAVYPKHLPARCRDYLDPG